MADDSASFPLLLLVFGIFLQLNQFLQYFYCNKFRAIARLNISQVRSERRTRVDESENLYPNCIHFVSMGRNGDGAVLAMIMKENRFFWTRYERAESMQES